MLNLHRLLFKESDPVSFHAELLPEDWQRLTLTDAKNKIRDHLRSAIANASITVLQVPRRIEPRFRTQGSWSYRACIRPAHLPPQEMDWDFGVYLPATFWQGNAPPFAAKAYFELVEGSLKSLCKENGWELVTGAERKDTCIRVRISHWAHIDVPLYAVPESQFNQITELAKSQGGRRRSMLAKDDALFLRESVEAGEPADFPWEELRDIMLATRKGEWKASDPFAVTRWFSDCIEEHGEQLRRLCRYLKAWRDYRWPDGGGPSSIVLMICAVEAFERRFHRDDIALQDAAERMSRMLRADIFVAGIDSKRENFNRLSDADRVVASERASSLRWAIQTSRSFGASLRMDAVQNLRTALGLRIPIDPNLVEVETEADRVRIAPAVAVAAPVVRSTRSG
jgi:hypothetical protein